MKIFPLTKFHKVVLLSNSSNSLLSSDYFSLISDIPDIQNSL